MADCTSGAQRIKDIVFEMQYFAYPETRQIESCRLEKIIDRVAKQFKTQLPPAASIQISHEKLPKIECNIPHMEKAIANILQNAVDAIETDGSITIRGQYENDTVLISVSDHGRGIEEQNLSKVFNPFFTTKEPGQGIGFGLTTSLNIIRMHNGSIDVKSKLHERTTFTVRLPALGN